jgi:hypothetical protein
MSAGIFNDKIKSDKIYYKAGYKYQLAKDYTIQLDPLTFFPVPADIVTEYIILTKDGLLTLKRAYAWDGCSGPTHDDKTNMRGGLLHDAGYQLLRLGLLPAEYKEFFDRLLKTICLEDGMWRIRAWYYFEGVHNFASFAAKKGSEPYPILTAP